MMAMQKGGRIHTYLYDHDYVRVRSKHLATRQFMLADGFDTRMTGEFCVE